MDRRVPPLAYAQLGADLVVLDTQKGDYLCIPQWKSQPGAAASPVDLIRSTYGVEPQPAFAAVEPTADLENVDGARVRAGEVVAFAAEAGAFYAFYPLRPFGSLLEGAAARSSSHLRTPADVVAAALVCRRLMPWAFRGGLCLYRSLLALRVLRRLRLDADLVLGVRTWPFEAHCWLQLQHLVLDERVDRALLFTPILVI